MTICKPFLLIPIKPRLRPQGLQKNSSKRIFLFVNGEFFDIFMRRHGFLLIVTLFIIFCARRSPRELEHDRKASGKAWWAERHRSLSSQFAIRNRKQYDAALVIYNRVQKCGSRSLLQAIRPTLEDNGVQFGAENLGKDLQKIKFVSRC